MWTITEHTNNNSRVELEVSIMIKEITGQYSYLTSSYQFKDKFEDEAKIMKRTNNFSVDLMYKVKIIDTYTAEVWKLTADGEWKKKMFTVSYKKPN